MIKDLQQYLNGIALGVRFRANFSIEDQLGKITDTILYSRKSFFNTEIFPHVRNSVGKKILINHKTSDTLTIDNSNFILETNFYDDMGFNTNDYNKIVNNFQKQIVKDVMNKFGIIQIVRIGLIKRYLFPIEALAKTFVDKTIGCTLDGVNDINLQFSKKMPLPEALVKKDVFDYCNAIFNIIKLSGQDNIFMSVDYQWFYSPFLEKANDIDFAPFIENAEKFNKNNYLNWLNTNYLEEGKDE
ncbi:MAG: hypothetical protein PHV82_03105 [Victivallaceae bacterium]|nr:hypothetical protein [Victivallaceae bacterium]